jgi:tetratricopeptide (TPR) repeat protein
MSHTQPLSSDILTLKNVLNLIDQQQKTQALELLNSHQFSGDYILTQRQIEADLLASMGERDRSERIYLMLMREYPDRFEPKFALCQLYQNAGRYAQALSIMNQILEEKPDFYMAWNNLGTIYRDLKEYSHAIESFNKSISLKNDYMPSVCNLCLTYLDIKKPELCIELAEKTLLTHPHIGMIYSHLAKAHLFLNSLEKAKNAVKIGLSYDPMLNTLIELEDQLFKDA